MSTVVAKAKQGFLHSAVAGSEGRGPLHELWAVALLVEHGLVQLGEAVSACRQDGVSDADIAGVLGISRQAVSQRWTRSPADVSSYAREVVDPGQESLPL